MKKEKDNTKDRVYSLNKPILYEIEIAGILNDDWSIWIDNVSVQVKSDDSGFVKTILAGELDQSALLGVIRRFIYLGFPLISIRSFPQTGNGSH